MLFRRTPSLYAMKSGGSVCSDGVHPTIYSESQLIWRTNIIQGDAVALVFAQDRNKPQGSGEIHFNLALSIGVSPIGPIFKGASVRVSRDKESSKCSTWLTAKREGSTDKLDGESILQILADSDINVLNHDLYLGVTKRRTCSIGTEKGKFVSYLAFHEVLGAHKQSLYVRGDGLKTGDTFQFFSPDPQIGLMSRDDVFDNLRALNQRNCDKKIVFGGLVFSCFCRGESFLGQPNMTVQHSWKIFLVSHYQVCFVVVKLDVARHRLQSRIVLYRDLQIASIIYIALCIL